MSWAPPACTPSQTAETHASIAGRRRAFSSINRPPKEANTSVFGGAAWRSSVTLYTLPVGVALLRPGGAEQVGQRCLLRTHHT